MPTIALEKPTSWYASPTSHPTEGERMSERDAYEPGVPCWVTTLQPDPDAAAGFYGTVFGWRAECGGGYLVARLRGRPVAAIAPLPPRVEPAPPPAWITHVSVADAEAAAEAATAAGGKGLARGDERGGPPRPAAGCSRASTSRPAGASSSPTPTARRSACGSRASAMARSSSTSPGPGR